MMDIGSRRELFADSFLADRLDGVRQMLHHPVPQNTILQFDAPWEGRSSAYAVVFRDGDLCRLYYRGGPRDEADRKRPDAGRCCYAESRDGIVWTKPNLGFCEYEGGRANNIVFTGEQAGAFAPFLDARPGVPPEQRYKALGPHGSDAQPGRMGLHAYASGDGLHWSRLQEAPVLTKGAFDSLNVAFWSEAEACYVCYFRIYSKTQDWRQFLGRRTIARATSADFVTWSEPERMEFGDVRTDELYTNATLPYFRAPHLYVAFPKRYVLGRNTPLTKEQIAAFGIPPGQTFISEGVFMTSRGGNRYDRTFMEGFFRPGPDPANWCSRNNMAAWGLLQTGPAEMSLYYSQHYSQPDARLIRATLRLDGFVSMKAGYGGGELITRPFVFSGSELELNMATSAVGSIRVEIQDAEGRPFRDYGIEDSYDLYGDSVAKTVKWHGSPDVSPLQGLPVRLRFVMKDADLYSLKFNPH
jgi:hypothetical protein